MCPSPDYSRKHAEKAHIDDLIEIAKHIPSDAGHLTVTGGEPFMAGEDIFRFLKFLQNKFTQTEFLILTNGRVFCLKKYVECLRETIPNNCIIGIPLHGSTNDVHDRITRSEGSFVQTLAGIKNLCKIGVRIELRLVVCRANLNDFNGIASLIINELHSVEHVSIMAMEMTGNAYVNKEEVWISYSVAFLSIKDAVSDLLNHGIDVRLYNFPLCSVDSQFWPICEKSISPSKIRFAEECDLCRFKSDCGGFFSGTYMLEKDELRAIK